MNEVLLKAENLCKEFIIGSEILKKNWRRLRAVDNVSFDLKKGEILSLVGESGCGKSTTARLVLRLIDPTAGRVEFAGQDLLALSDGEMRGMRRSMQIIFQDPYSSLNPRMRIGNILAEPFVTHNLCPKSEIKDRVAELLKGVGLPPSSARRYPHEFSGGQRQRVGIARALALEPKMIVCDEPISALDVSIQAQVVNLLRDLQEERELSYLFITHDLRVVRHISSRVAVMYLGRIVESGKTSLLFKNPMHPYTQALFSAIPAPDPDRKNRRVILKGDVPSPVNPPAGCTFHPRCSQAVPVCSREAPLLKNYEEGHACACHLYK